MREAMKRPDGKVCFDRACAGAASCTLFLYSVPVLGALVCWTMERPVVQWFNGGALQSPDSGWKGSRQWV